MDKNFGYEASPKEAKKKGHLFYYTGKPCKRGHKDVRLVSDKGCYSCSYEKQGKGDRRQILMSRLCNAFNNHINEEVSGYPNSPKKAIRLGYDFYYTGIKCLRGHDSIRRVKGARCFTCETELRKLYYRYNKNSILANCKRWRKENLDRDKDTKKQYRLNNRNFLKFLQSFRRYAIQQATPLWEDEELLELVYSECPQGYEVDHYYPINGDNVCGLNTVSNLQYLDKKLNKKKSNKHPLEFYNEQPI